MKALHSPHSSQGPSNTGILALGQRGGFNNAWHAPPMVSSPAPRGRRAQLKLKLKLEPVRAVNSELESGEASKVPRQSQQKKRLKQDVGRRQRMRGRLTAIRNSLRSVIRFAKAIRSRQIEDGGQALSADELEELEALEQEVRRAIFKGINKHAIKKNNGRRKLSRLLRLRKALLDPAYDPGQNVPKWWRHVYERRTGKTDKPMKLPADRPWSKKSAKLLASGLVRPMAFKKLKND